MKEFVNRNRNAKGACFAGYAMLAGFPVDPRFRWWPMALLECYMDSTPVRKAFAKALTFQSMLDRDFAIRKHVISGSCRAIETDPPVFSSPGLPDWQAKIGVK